jgi:hypothetical protein
VAKHGYALEHASPDLRAAPDAVVAAERAIRGRLRSACLEE